MGRYRMTHHLVLDGPFMVYRAYAGLGKAAEGIVYAALRNLSDLQDLFNAAGVVWCFDAGSSRRAARYPTYKSARNARYAAADPKQRAERELVWRQTAAMRDGLLQSLGYGNVLFADGFEADDVIATVVRDSLPPGDDAVIISSDHDLWQLAGPRVIWHDPSRGRTVTAASFQEEWGLEPIQFADILAIAGCDGDTVVGVPRVGKLTAARYLNGTLNKRHKIYATLEGAEAHKIWRDNLWLVELPLEGTPQFELVENAITAELWDNVAAQMGLDGAPPPVAAMRSRAVY